MFINDTYFGSGVRNIANMLRGDRLEEEDGDGGCLGPIFFYTGNEGPIEGFWDSNGFMQYLTVEYGGLLVMAEQRYYGRSVPSSSSSSSTNLVLTTGRVLEDYVAIIHHVKTKYSATSCPVIAFGGSYGGTLAALLRQKYPWAVQGALAASSELGYYDIDNWPEHGITQYTFSDIIGKSYYDISPKCLQTIYDTSKILDDFGRTDADLVMKEFNFCSTKALVPSLSSIFIYGLEGLPQMNYPYQIGQRPEWPVRAACNMLLEQVQNNVNYNPDASSADQIYHRVHRNDNIKQTSERSFDSSRNPSKLQMLRNAAKVTAMSLGYSLNDTNNCFVGLDEGPGNIPGDGPGLGSWGYQSCTETLHEFSSAKMKMGENSEHSNSSSTKHFGLRDYDYESKQPGLDGLCRDLYNVTPNPRTLTEKYGGFDVVNVTTNTIFSMGELDPWGGGFVVGHDREEEAEERRRRSSRGVYGFRMPNGAHHLDLRGWHQDEPFDVRRTRLEEEQIIVGWIAQYLLDARQNQNQSTA